MKRDQWQAMVDSAQQWITYCTDPSNTFLQAAVLEVIGFGRLMLGQYEEAVTVLRRCVSMGPDNAGCWEKMGEALFGLNDTTRAKIAFSMAVDSGGVNDVNAKNIRTARQWLDFIDKMEQTANGPSDSVHLSAKEQEAFAWIKCNGVTIGYIPITPARSATCPARQFTQLSPKEQEAAMWSRQVAPLCGYALRADIASITDYRRQDQLTDKEKDAIALLRKVAPFSGFLLTSDVESTQSADKSTSVRDFRQQRRSHSNKQPCSSRMQAADDARRKAPSPHQQKCVFRFGSFKGGYSFCCRSRFQEQTRPQLGDSVVVFGFPLPDVLSSDGNVTTGILSAASGLQDDVRFVQISAPVQPGNSGGPLFDQSGHVIGVVVAKLDALSVARVNGDIPQNVNFAVSWWEVKAFLDAEGVPYRKATSQQGISTSDIAALARRMSVAIDCTE